MAEPLFEIRFDGLRQVQERLEQVQDLLEYNLRQAVIRTVLYGAGRIAEDTPVDTGRLRASIGGDVIDTSAGGDPAAVAEGRRESLTTLQGLTGIIGTNVRYAIYQEFGWQPKGPKKLTRKQLRYLFAVGILKTVKTAGGRRVVVPGDRDVTRVYRVNGRTIRRQYTVAGVDVAINRRAGVTTRVKGRGFFRKNIPAIRQFFLRACEEAVRLALEGKEMRVTL